MAFAVFKKNFAIFLTLCYYTYCIGYNYAYINKAK